MKRQTTISLKPNVIIKKYLPCPKCGSIATMWNYKDPDKRKQIDICMNHECRYVFVKDWQKRTRKSKKK